MNQKVDTFLDRSEQWRDEFKRLRAIILESQLEEEFKWGVPCYALGGKNVVLIHGFKEYCAILFVKGSLFKDDKGALITQTENVQAGRQIRFTSLQEIIDLEEVIKSYIAEAIAVEKAGLKVPVKPAAEYPVPLEFQAALDQDPVLEDAFKSLSPGRQKGYLLFFNGAKQAKTIEARVEKCIPKIMDGLGLDDA